MRHEPVGWRLCFDLFCFAEQEFTCTNAVFNLTEKKDVKETESRIAIYEAAHRDDIIANRVRQVQVWLQPLGCEGENERCFGSWPLFIAGGGGQIARRRSRNRRRSGAGGAWVSVLIICSCARRAGFSIRLTSTRSALHRQRQAHRISGLQTSRVRLPGRYPRCGVLPQCMQRLPFPALSAQSQPPPAQPPLRAPLLCRRWRRVSPSRWCGHAATTAPSAQWQQERALCVPTVWHSLRGGADRSPQDPRQQGALQPIPLGVAQHHTSGADISEAEARENDRKAALASGYPPGAATRPATRRPRVQELALKPSLRRAFLSAQPAHC